MTPPFWRGPQERWESWARIRASPYLCRQIRYGIHDPPKVPFTSGEILSELPQTAEDVAFATEDLSEGCELGIYEYISESQAEKVRKQGFMVSSSFVVWRETEDGSKGRFVINFHKQSKHWPKGSIKMETLPAYALDLNKGDHLISFDINPVSAT